MTSTAQTGYAPVNGLNMYYEIHGSGGVVGDNIGLPRSQLAILPGTTHITAVYRAVAFLTYPNQSKADYAPFRFAPCLLHAR